MNEEFFNPYHFVPVAQRDAEQTRNDLAPDRLHTDRAGATTHERYLPAHHSGRLECRLTTKTPLVVGAQQNRAPGTIGHVEPYMVRERDQANTRPAIPGSSLRGLISSLAEAASNSAPRVLDGRPYSYRKPFKPEHTLSAIGMIVREGNEELRLKPVALPTLELATHQGRPLGHYIVPPRFRRIFPRPALKVYIGDRHSIRDANFPYRTSTNGRASSTHPVSQLHYNAQGHLVADPSLHCKDKGRPTARGFIPKYFAVAQDTTAGAPTRPGFLRVLGCWGDRDPHIPHGKIHELWLPAPGPDVQARPIAPKALDRFRQLADERTDASLAGGPLLPFHPLDTRRNENQAQFKDKFRLKHGDLVYFDVADDDAGTVTEIALSAIWRGQVTTTGTPDGDPAGAHEFFGAVDPNLVPFSARRRLPDSNGKITGRITIAERMFGFVEENTPGPATDATDEQGLALASRIRFSDALLPDGVSAEAALEAHCVPLRILSSPKPPSPSLYFKHQDGRGGWIAKTSLSPQDHDPQGRKMYLHHTVQEGAKPWKTDHPDANPDQKNDVRPVYAGQKFYFHVDYDNLTDAELGLLLYALAPSPTFHHKLGMGKPLGLGSVKVEVLRRTSVDRQQRYTLAGLQADRHHEVLEPSAQPETFWDPRDKVIADGLVSEEIHDAICLLGTFDGAPPSEQIDTPTLIDQNDAETETYLWFVANDTGLKPPHREMPPQEQALTPLPESPGELPRLRRP